MRLEPECLTIFEFQFFCHVQFVNNIVNDVDADNFMLARTLDILEFRCVYPTVQMTTGEINPLVQYVE